MANPLLGNLFSHWHKPYDDFETSALDFYSSVDAGLGRRQIPEISSSRVTWREGGIGTPKREYLRVSRKGMAFDICAAPFGTGYFFSWWLGSPGARWFHWVIVVIAILVPVQIAAVSIPDDNAAIIISSIICILILVAPYLRIISLLSRKLSAGIDDAVGKIPLIGLLYRYLFTRPTYYRLDTTLMFQSAVHSVVCEVIDGLATAKGLRALEADEKKPIMRDLLKP